MTWASQNAELIGSIRAYVRKFENQRPPLFQYFGKGNKPCFNFPLQSEKGMKVLLIYSALNQDITEDELAEFVIKLYARHSDDLFFCNQITFGSLKSSIEYFIPGGWILGQKVPGILRSVGDFFLVHGDLGSLIQRLKSSEELVKLLSREIFFMGKSSIMKFKARNFVWMLALAFTGKGINIWNDSSLLPVSPGANRFMYFVGPLKSRKAIKLTGEEKIDYFNRFYRFLFPEESWKVNSAFNAFKRRMNSRLFECRSVLSGCGNCPLDKYCSK